MLSFHVGAHSHDNHPCSECDWVVVDHLHMLVNVLTEGDERRGIDMLMNRLRSLVEETGVGMILVSHLRRAQGDRGHEKGIQVSLSHLKGSQGIAQLSDCVIALERNQQSDDEFDSKLGSSIESIYEASII